MDEVRCPMCSKKNPADAEECEFCGARIKPLIIQQPSEEPPSRSEQVPPSLVEEPKEEPQERSPQETDWLSRMRSGVESEGESESDLPAENGGLKRGETDLLGRFRDLGISDDDLESEAELPSTPESEIPLEFESDVPIEPVSEAPFLSEKEPELDMAPPEPEPEGEPQPFDRVLPKYPLEEKEDGAEPEEPVVPDWLARIRARKEEEETEAPPSRGDTDWLSTLREVTFEEETEEEALPDSFEEVFPLDTTPEATPELDSLSSKGPDHELSPAGDIDGEMVSAQTSIEDLFSELDSLPMEEDEGPKTESPADLEQPSAAEEDLLDMDELFKDFEVSASAEQEELRDVKAFVEPLSQPSMERDSFIHDDLFTDFDEGAGGKEQEIGEDLFGYLDEESMDEDEPLLDEAFFADLGIEVSEDAEQDQKFDTSPELAQAVEETSPTEPADDDRQLDSLGIHELAPGSDALAKEPIFEDFDSDAFTPFDAEPLEEAPADESSIEDLLGDVSPSWMDDTEAPFDDDLPHVPALIMDDEMPLLDAGVGEDDTASMEIPAWLQNLGADVEDDLDEEEDIPVLAKATLPPWLEAMRPIETFQASHEIELELEEEEEIVEAAGPLAGLRGVLLAEPVVAMPRTPVVSMGALDITDRDLNHAEILQGMVEEEESEEGRLAVKSVHVPILRWLCAVILLLGVTLPSLMDFPRFKTPFDLESPRQPRELPVTLEVIDSVPFDQPALIIYDYEPSFSAEMDAVAGALVEDLFSRGQVVVSLSTQTSGPMLADRMLKRVGVVRAGINGEDYLHLGYLAGGTTAMQLFASSPRDALLNGFDLPESFEGESIWDSPLLESVNTLSDFALVTVISSGTENARNWAEQVQPLLGNTPLIMVVSAGVEPLIHPYYETEDPQIDGILSGLPSALIYEGFNGLQADAFRRWSSYGTGALITALILIAGTVYGAVTWLVQHSSNRQS
jgi:hypothetical protein